MLTLLVVTVSFTNIKERKDKETTHQPFVLVSKHKEAVSSNSENLVVSLVINSSGDVITQMRVFRTSDCVEYSWYGYTGYISHSGSNYYANNLVIDLGASMTVTLDGLLDNNLTECDES